MGQAPAFARIVEAGNGLQVGGVPDEADAVVPGQGDEAAVDLGQAFAEIFAGEFALLQHDAVFQPHAADAGGVAARAFEQHAVANDQALGEGGRVVGEGPHHLIAIDGRSGVGRGGSRRGGRPRRLRPRRRGKRQQKHRQDRPEMHDQTPGSAVSALFRAAWAASAAWFFLICALRDHMFSTSTRAEKAMAA
ncbi:hypothetical protein D3C85_1155320 [compost metagenome]